MKMLIVLLAHVGFRFREVLQAVSDVPGYWWMQVDQPTYSRPLELLQSEGYVIPSIQTPRLVK